MPPSTRRSPAPQHPGALARTHNGPRPSLLACAQALVSDQGALEDDNLALSAQAEGLRAECAALRAAAAAATSSPPPSSRTTTTRLELELVRREYHDLKRGFELLEAERDEVQEALEVGTSEAWPYMEEEWEERLPRPVSAAARAFPGCVYATTLTTCTCMCACSQCAVRVHHQAMMAWGLPVGFAPALRLLPGWVAGGGGCRAPRWHARSCRGGWRRPRRRGTRCKGGWSTR